jgi:hypothetical protein
MVDRHGQALSRTPRSLPLSFVSSGKRNFKPRFGAIRAAPNQLPAVQT